MTSFDGVYMTSVVSMAIALIIFAVQFFASEKSELWKKITGVIIVFILFLDVAIAMPKVARHFNYDSSIFGINSSIDGSVDPIGGSFLVNVNLGELLGFLH